MKPTEEMLRYAREYFREITRKGGKARWAKVSAEERTEAARKLAQTRWAKYYAKKAERPITGRLVNALALINYAIPVSLFRRISDRFSGLFQFLFAVLTFPRFISIAGTPGNQGVALGYEPFGAVSGTQGTQFRTRDASLAGMRLHSFPSSGKSVPWTLPHSFAERCLGLFKPNRANRMPGCALITGLRESLLAELSGGTSMPSVRPATNAWVFTPTRFGLPSWPTEKRNPIACMKSFLGNNPRRNQPLRFEFQPRKLSGQPGLLGKGATSRL